MSRAFLLLCAVAFLLIGVNTFIDPLAALAPVDLDVNSVDALNELRANYGGLQLGIALLLLAGVRYAAWRRPALLAQALLVGGLACGRLASIAIDGRPGDFMLGLLLLESVIAILSLLLFLREPRVAG